MFYFALSPELASITSSPWIPALQIPPSLPFCWNERKINHTCLSPHSLAGIRRGFRLIMCIYEVNNVDVQGGELEVRCPWLILLCCSTHSSQPPLCSAMLISRVIGDPLRDELGAGGRRQTRLSWVLSSKSCFLLVSLGLETSQLPAAEIQDNSTLSQMPPGKPQPFPPPHPCGFPPGAQGLMHLQETAAPISPRGSKETSALGEVVPRREPGCSSFQRGTARPRGSGDRGSPVTSVCPRGSVRVCVPSTSLPAGADRPVPPRLPDGVGRSQLLASSAPRPVPGPRLPRHPPRLQEDQRCSAVNAAGGVIPCLP